MQLNYQVFIAVSADGFIADQDGSVAFLNDLNIKKDGGYTKFYNSIDALVYGSKTYDFIKAVALEWPYNKKSFVLTSRLKAYTNDKLVTFTNDDLETLDQKLKGQGFKNIWVMGGANVIAQYLKKQAITKMIISYTNNEVKAGTKLFSNLKILDSFKIVKTENYGDIKNITYVKKEL